MGKITRSIPAPTSGTEDFLLQDLSLGSSSVRPQDPEAPPHPRDQSCPVLVHLLEREGGQHRVCMDFLTRKRKENLFFTFGSETEKKQFQDPLVAKSKTNVPQGMGTHGCSQVTTPTLSPRGGVSLEEFQM